MTLDELERDEERLEFWDRHTETAWRVRDASTWHEQPGQRLAMLAARVASVRGAPIECFGSSSLARLDAGGRPWQILQADNVLYLHPSRWKKRGRVDVGAGLLPDVVLEVDHTTDVRRWKLGMYQAWGFPEIWVLVPSKRSRRVPGLAIHVRDSAGGYRQAPESTAFPGWTADEVYRALTEEPLSAASWQALERVGRMLGERGGTTPEDDPLTRSLQARASADAVVAALRARGIDVPADVAADPDLLCGCSVDIAMAVALTCSDAADFRRRIRRAAG
ncbi:MAG: Uma2 family endonuclease [Acidobacteria bacterium]|nr:Uma2 family endonuclease [Acidobacteriota bacterium]